MDICTLRRRRDQEQVESISLSMRKNSPPKWKNASTFEFGSQRSMKLEILHLFFSCLCRSEWCVFNAQQLLRTQRRTAQKAWSLLGHKAETFQMSWAEKEKTHVVKSSPTNIRLGSDFLSEEKSGTGQLPSRSWMYGPWSWTIWWIRCRCLAWSRWREFWREAVGRFVEDRSEHWYSSVAV